MLKKLIIILVLPLLLTGCSALTGEEIGRLKINKISTGAGNIFEDKVTLELKEGDEINFWSDMDLEFEGALNIRFRVLISKNENKISEFKIDPTVKNITIGEVKTTLMNKTKWSFTGKNSEFKIKEDATYTIKAILISDKNPSLKVSKAELVLKK